MKAPRASAKRRGPDEWEVRDAVNTVTRAHQYLSDSRMRKAMERQINEASKLVKGGIMAKGPKK